ncbi:MAG: hypothetical protein HONDAALG_00508 [Gammaproteobacteria bacterium]|nr:hypothetical protein [Gammaproteobacteria bacterium]
MPVKDLHSNSFDESTLTKLDIFEKYLMEWLPVFLHTKNVKKIAIWDFFAGPGCDPQKNPGSPLRILESIVKYRENIFQSTARIHVVFNDALRKKADALSAAIEGPLREMIQLFRDRLVVNVISKDFQDLFNDQYSEMQGQPNLIFLDQNGVKEVSDEVFQKLIQLERTDFLFFMSSSYLKRFATSPEMNRHFPDLDLVKLQSSSHQDVHRLILDYYRGKIPRGDKTRLYPFTLKKGTNVYGLIFGSRHPLGVEKFLKVAWDKNELNGEANFDIDGDGAKLEPSLFPNWKGFTKKQKFALELEAFIGTKQELTNREVYEFTLGEGHPASHAHEAIHELRNSRKIVCDGRIGFSYNSCFKKPLKTIKVVNHG